jgi:CxxC motif-containing protein (DUF1111 family)
MSPQVFGKSLLIGSTLALVSYRFYLQPTGDSKIKASEFRAEPTVSPIGAAIAYADPVKTRPSEDFSLPLPDTIEVPATSPHSGGATTVDVTGIRVFNTPAANIRKQPVEGQMFSHDLQFLTGNSIFTNPWVEAGATTVTRDGLGPLFNANSCESCHMHDGKGSAVGSDGRLRNPGLLVRLSTPGKTAQGGPRPDPIYGGQIQDHAIHGVPIEATIEITWEEITSEFADGTGYTLRKPHYHLRNLGYGPLADDIKQSPRIATLMVGLGLLEHIPQESLVAFADADDIDGDGISGKLNWVWDEKTQSLKPGRFGWKASQPSVRQQNAAAFRGDIGITSNLFSKTSCMPTQKECLSAADGGTPELTDKQLDRLEVYTKLIGVPKRRNTDHDQVIAGERLFYRLACNRCHVSTWVTADTPEFPELSEQTIHPYTDLLLHDMGPDLADDRPVFKATGREWRTAPLWGIGLVQSVNPEAGFLHDGRARTLQEAILWHGGEAEASKLAFKGLTAKQRAALLTFLKSL